MINIRNNVFETNSSSTHSVTVKLSSHGLMETIVPKNGTITFRGGDFSDADLYLKSAERKTDCVAVYIHFTENQKEKDIFESTVKEHTGAKDIKYNIFISGPKINSYMSCEVMYEIRKIFHEKKLKNFLFNKDSYLEAGIDENY